MSSVLTVEGLHVGLVGRPINVVEDVSFALSPGEILGLVGESGSGKTTVALAALGYAKPGLSINSGSVAIAGQDVLTCSPGDLRRLRGKVVSYVPQDPSQSLNPAMRIGKQLGDVLKEHGFGADDAERRARVLQMLEEVSLPAEPVFLRRYPHELSGGQQQRVGIAMAFACRPRVVVLDEPTTGLDVTTQANVLATVRDLAAGYETAAVYVSHDLAVVAELSSRIAVMYGGRLVEQGPTDQVIAAAAHPYTRKLIETIPDPNRRRQLVGIPGRVAPLGLREPGCCFAARCPLVEDACRVAPMPDFATGRPGHTVQCRRWQTATEEPSRVVEVPALPVARHHAGDEMLRVEGLEAWYGANQVLRGASLAIRKGECLALVGESGSGKTTLARTISGLHRHATGRVHVDGVPVPLGSRANRPPELLKSVQYIFQNPYGSLNPRKSIHQLLEQPLRQFGLECGPGRVAELLELVSLSPRYAARYPSQLSGGERQRVAIARALATGPQLLVCDEMTSALDVSVQASILALLARLHAESGLTVLFVTHNLAVVRAVADDVVVLNGGVIVEAGPVDQVLDDPSDTYTQGLLANTPGLLNHKETSNGHR